jgi:hypothetical protein
VIPPEIPPNTPEIPPERNSVELRGRDHRTLQASTSPLSEIPPPLSEIPPERNSVDGITAHYKLRHVHSEMKASRTLDL